MYIIYFVNRNFLVCWRKENGLTRFAAARQCGVSWGSYTFWEKGFAGNPKGKLPNKRSFERISVATGHSANEIEALVQSLRKEQPERYMAARNGVRASG